MPKLIDYFGVSCSHAFQDITTTHNAVVEVWEEGDEDACPPDGAFLGTCPDPGRVVKYTCPPAGTKINPGDVVQVIVFTKPMVVRTGATRKKKGRKAAPSKTSKAAKRLPPKKKGAGRRTTRKKSARRGR